MIAEHGIDYCIVINFSSRFANVTSDDFIKIILLIIMLKEVIAGFDFLW